jgi:hypothetical protein
MRRSLSGMKAGADCGIFSGNLFPGGGAFIIYGYRTEAVNLADMGLQPCMRCATARSCELVLRYTYLHLYWIFGAVVRRRYFGVCQFCGNAAALEKAQVPADAPSAASKIHFMHRWGLAILIAGIAAIIYAAAKS